MTSCGYFITSAPPTHLGLEKIMALAVLLQARLSAAALLSCAHDILDDYINP